MRSSILTASLLLFAACSETVISPLPSPVEIRMSRNETTDLSALGTYVRAVPLETTDATLLGMVNSAKIDPLTGDILVGDYRVSKTILRFDGTGGLLRQEGALGKGPGEYESLQAFHPLADGKLLVCGLHKLIIYDTDGGLLVERSMSLAVNWVTTIRDRIYVRAVSGTSAEKAEMLELNGELEVIRRFHPRDPRLRKIIFIPHASLAATGDQLLVSDLYDPRVTTYDPDGNPVRSWMLPNDNHLLESRFGRAKSMKQHELFAFFDDIHRFLSIHAVGDRLFIHETHPSNGLSRPILLDPTGGTATAFTSLKLVGGDAAGNYLTLTTIVGSYEDGLIGICDDKARFDAAKANHPELAEIEVAETDNPVLLFFRLNDREPRM